MSNKTDFDPLDLDKKIPGHAKDAIINLLQAWALFEIALTDWLIASIGTNQDIGTLLFQRVSTNSKIDKLKQIYAHVGAKTDLEKLKELSRLEEKYSQIRDAVVHNMFLGTRNDASDETQCELIYSRHRPAKNRMKSIEAVVIRTPDIKAAATFAITSTKVIRAALPPKRRG